MDEILDPALGDEVLERLGLATPPAADLEGLRALYAAWCARVPFDNLRKLIGLARGASPLPGDDPNDFFRAWLADGTGATCWASSNALWSLARHCGFDAARLTAAMFDLPDPNHGTGVVRIDDDHWIIDSSILSGAPLPLGDAVGTVAQGGYWSRIAPDAGTWLISFPSAGFDDGMVCRIFDGVADGARYQTLHEATRTWSVFNDVPHLRRSFDGDTVSLNDHSQSTWTNDGLVTIELTDGERHDWLVRTGYSDRIVTEVEATLAASS